MVHLGRVLHAGGGDCEALAARGLLQAANAISSLGFSVAGVLIILWARSAPGVERSYRIGFGSLMVATGIGSFVYHGSAAESGQFLHDFTFLATIWTLAMISFGRVRGMPWTLTWGSVAGGSAVLALLLVAAPSITNLLTAGLVVALIASDIVLARSGHLARGWRVAAIVLMSAAIVAYFVGRTGGPLCEPGSLLQPHAIWHLLAAGALAAYFVATSAVRAVDRAAS
ncbi:MAG: hypothetical protein R2823_07680 [Acidimicrobiia bacterium]